MPVIMCPGCKKRVEVGQKDLFLTSMYSHGKKFGVTIDWACPECKEDINLLASGEAHKI